MKSAATWIVVGLAVFGAFWTAATQWQALNDRVAALEKEQTYFHGQLPKGAVER